MPSMEAIARASPFTFSSAVVPVSRLHVRASTTGKSKSKPNPIPVSSTRRLVVSPEHISTTRNGDSNGRFEKNREEAVKNSEADKKTEKGYGYSYGSSIDDVKKSSLKEYAEYAKELVKSDGGPPRWFSPLETGSRLKNSPLLLFLPGLDGTGLGLVLHHQSLGEIFDMWCLHIPVMDRTPFTDLVKMIERTVRSENHNSPGRPIYLVGESLGGCLALAVASRNPDIDLSLILANPATSFSKSQLQLLIPLLEIVPDQLHHSLPYMLRIFRGFPLQQTVGELTQDLDAMSSYISVLAGLFPKETLLWKQHMLKSASAFANSRLHSVKAHTLLLSSGRDQLLPSEEECERLLHTLPKCDIRKFSERGHFLFLEDGFDLVTIIKGAGFYRRAKYLDYVHHYVPPTPSEFEKLREPFRLYESVTSSVMFSTIENGKIVRGLAGIPSEGPVLFVGYHMLLGIDLIPIIFQFMAERNINLRGIAHPIAFEKSGGGKLPDISMFDYFRHMGAVPVSATNLYKLLSSKAHVLLYPGGMREVLHRKGEEYKLFWPEQSEFIRMAARVGAKIIPFGTVGEDDFCQVLFDYDDLMKIPFYKAIIEDANNDISGVRTDTKEEVANQAIHLPVIHPKFPGRFYYYFGKPIETEGRKQELRDKEKAHELYIEVKSEVEKCLAYLKEKREKDPYRNILSRLTYWATHRFTNDIPTFEP